ncbi:MAG: ABC transporter ATP-binding protein [Planctomycetes bacterium]|nr:ABC transporter ATP-binding protein [Planctomycetota bacterium]
MRPDDALAPVLAFERVTRWYGHVVALMDVSFEVGREVVGLVGQNGVGKSTLMKLAAGLLRPSQGQVRVCGRDATTRAARSEVGYCPDFEALPEGCSGAHYVTNLLRYHGHGARSAAERARAVLQELGLGQHLDRSIGEYSKGMRQRVRLAQALAHEPRFVLLDEPMTGLDPVARSELAVTIRALPARGIGVLVSSHVLHELESVVDRVVLVHQGRLLASGRIGELRRLVPELPQRVRLVAARQRELAACLLQLPQVVAVNLTDRDQELQVTVQQPREFLRELTRLGASGSFVIEAVQMMDDNLASVFGHLVG